MGVPIGDQYVFEWVHPCSLFKVAKITKQGLCQRGAADWEFAAVPVEAAECQGGVICFAGVCTDHVVIFLQSVKTAP
jgi:hypothetical protein